MSTSATAEKMECEYNTENRNIKTESIELNSHELLNTNKSQFTINCAQCTDYATKLSVLSDEYAKIQVKCEQLLNENRALQAQIQNKTTLIATINCGLCHATLSDGGLNKHICLDHDEISCEYCLATFNSTIDLQLHFTETEHSNITFYQCDNCEKAFPMALLLHFHQTTEQNHLKLELESIDTPTIDCSPINQIFLDDSNDSTVEESVKAKSPLAVKKPEKKIKLAHRKTTKQPIVKNGIFSIPWKLRQYQCYVCKMEPKTLKELRNHLNQHIPIFEQMCEICGEKVTMDEYKLHSCDAKINFKCEYCDRSFNVTYEILQHLRNDHKNKTLHKCRKCGRYFEMMQLKNLHENMHQNQPEHYQPYKCSYCPNRYKQKSTLRVHMLNHTGEKNHLCSNCGKSFKTADLLKIHHRVHAEKTHQCPECPSSFKAHKNLRLHMQMHQNLQIKCSQCSAVFASKRYLIKHERNRHKNVAKNFACPFCPWKFNENNKLENHLRRHTGDKPFVCEFCAKKYAYKGDLNKHLRTHVGDNIYKCDECGQGFRLLAEIKQHSIEHYKQKKEQSQLS